MVWSKSTINGWRVLTWQCDVTLGFTWQYVKQSRGVGRMGTWGAWELARVSAWEILMACGSACSWGRNFSRRVWCGFWPFLVGFCSGLAVLSLYAFALAVGWAERWYPRVAGIVGVIAMTHFWQWLLDEGEGSGRTPEMFTGTRKSDEWL